MYAALRRAAARVGAPALAASAAALGAGLHASASDTAPAPAAADDGNSTPPAPQPSAASSGGAPVLAPVRLHLIHAQVLFRHGHRVPVHTHAGIETDDVDAWVVTPRVPEAVPSVVCLDAVVRAGGRGGRRACG